MSGEGQLDLRLLIRATTRLRVANWGGGEDAAGAGEMDEVEGNKPSDAGSTFQLYGPVQRSVIGTHNTVEPTNNFDFRAIERRTEREGDEACW